MDEARHDSEPANPEDDPLRRIAALERRVAVLTRENERLESFLVALHSGFDEFKRLGRGLGSGRDMHVPSSRVPDLW